MSKFTLSEVERLLWTTAFAMALDPRVGSARCEGDGMAPDVRYAFEHAYGVVEEFRSARGKPTSEAFAMLRELREGASRGNTVPQEHLDRVRRNIRKAMLMHGVDPDRSDFVEDLMRAAIGMDPEDR